MNGGTAKAICAQLVSVSLCDAANQDRLRFRRSEKRSRDWRTGLPEPELKEGGFEPARGFEIGGSPRPAGNSTFRRQNAGGGLLWSQKRTSR
jgi:hypothetical protein